MTSYLPGTAVGTWDTSVSNTDGKQPSHSAGETDTKLQTSATDIDCQVTNAVEKRKKPAG